MPPKSLRRLAHLTVVAAALVASRPAEAHDPTAVLVVVNSASPASAQVGEHYIRLRDVPEANVVRLPMPTTEEVTREQYLRSIENPLARWFTRHAAHDRILFVVLTKGVPLRVAGSTGRQGTVASVDSELALLYRRMTGRPLAPGGPVPNPYFLGARPSGDARPFARADHDLFLVTRLDGFTAEDAMALATRGRQAASAASAPAAGTVALDMKAAVSDPANEWLRAAAARLGEMGMTDRVLLETTSAVVRDRRDLLGYYSWGSNDPSNRERQLGLHFVPGAIAGQFVSSDARTFVEPPPGWSPGTWERRQDYYAGSPQSLAGDLVRQGVTGVSAQVAEPFLDAAVRPDILFPTYLSGFTLAEAYYLALPSLSWQTIVLGDPLARVAPASAAPAPPADSTIDPATQLPALFARRRLEQVPTAGLNLDAVKAMLRYEVLDARGETVEARKALEEAAALDKTMAGPRLALAGLAEQEGDHKAAIARYREVLAANGNNIVALNNLAFSLAVHQKLPADALPLAERAYTLSRGDATIADTVGWVHHLLGNRAQAARFIGEALRGAGENGEVRLHAAAILAAAGDVAGAKRELAKALELDPTIETRRADVVSEIRARQ